MKYWLLYTEAASMILVENIRQSTRLEFDSMREVITGACGLIDRGKVVWKIEGSAGFRMERRDIEEQHKCRTPEILR